MPVRRAAIKKSANRWEGGSGWGAHVNPWLIHVNVWQKPLQYCKVISLQLTKINGKKNIITINAEEGAEKKEISYTLGGNANLYSHYGEQCAGASLKNWK